MPEEIAGGADPGATGVADPGIGGGQADGGGQAPGAGADGAGAAGGAAAGPPPPRDTIRAAGERVFKRAVERMKAGPPGGAGIPAAGAAGGAAGPAGAEAEAGPEGQGQGGVGGEDLLQEFGFVGQYSPEDRAMLSQTVGQFHEWAQAVQEYGQEAEQRSQQAEALLARIEKVAADPRFKAALETVTRGGPAAGAVPAAGGKPPEFETETEQRLWNELQQVRGGYDQQGRMIQGLHQKLQEIAAQQGVLTEQSDAQALQELQGTIASVHKELDAQFPDLARDRGRRKAWHAKAAKLLQAEQAAGGRPDLRQALIDAARLLTYDDASKRGATTALTAAKTAARGSTFREIGTKPGQPARGKESLKQIGERLLKEKFPNLNG